VERDGNCKYDDDERCDVNEAEGECGDETKNDKKYVNIWKENGRLLTIRSTMRMVIKGVMRKIKGKE
jgi:hypothetical protein